MSQRPDPRLDEAQALPIEEIADRLALQLRRVTATEKAGPCPACGGFEKPDSDRFAINTRKNVFHCRRCAAAGDGIALVRLALGCDFRSALTWLVGESDLVLDPAEVARRRERSAAEAQRRAEIEAQERARAIRDAGEIWGRAEGHDLAPVRAYLAARGITFPHWPPTVRCIPDHPYRRKIGGQWQTWHSGPCMIAAIWAPDRALRAVHQTWIDPDRPGEKAQIVGPDGEALPAKLVRGSKKGGAIRLSPFPAEGGCLVVGEGIETTASAMMADAVPGASYWAGVDLGNMAGRQRKIEGKRWSGLPDLGDRDAFLPPPTLGRLVYLQDGDSAPGPTRAKLEAGLRRAMAHNPGLRAEIVAAPEGQDFNDMIRGGGADDDGSDDHTPQG